ncbi:hypothetical protein H8683_06300 [Helicobacter pylori]|uniref:hypothetical protein n=1 Tax=Helicobacter pylori TaxID=210 RepID=UPI00193293F6|nr:hypothetical protein [Helicobacter pylori]MBS3011090.1 hypothetical protein [Helicobacter pylori]MBS3017000.1 hypothetical protein [Helicobacter pylori]
MRQKHETAASFTGQLSITQAIMLKKDALTNATHQESERTQESNNANANTPERTQQQQTRAQTSENADISDLTQRTGSKPKAMLHAKKSALNPTKKAFSERQITAFRDNSQASDEKRLQTDQANNSSLKAKPSNKAFKLRLAKHQKNQKGGSNEA